MAAVSASAFASLYTANAFASGATKRASGPQSALAAKASTEVEDRLSEALKAMKRAPDEQKQATRNRARERVQAVREQLKIIKELYSQSPKEMAKALRHLVKELKSALKAYKDAGGDMTSIGASGLTAMASHASPAPAGAEATDLENSSDDPQADEALAEAVDDTPDTDSEPDAPDAPSPASVAEEPSPRQARASIEALETRFGELKGDEEFILSVDGLKRKIKDLFETAKIQSAFLARDKTREGAFEALDEDLKALDEDVTEYQRDVQDELIATRLEIRMIERGELSAPSGLDVSV